MGFRMSCDRCGRFMKNVRAIDLKKMSDGEIVCPVCQKVEAKVKSDVERMKLVAQGEINKMVDKYKETIIEIVQRHVEDGDSSNSEE